MYGGAASDLARLDSSAGGERLYQFSLVPEAKVVIDAVLALGVAVGTNILAAIIYDAAKGFLKRSASEWCLTSSFASRAGCAETPSSP
jgi:hypothetical protein